MPAISTSLEMIITAVRTNSHIFINFEKKLTLRTDKIRNSNILIVSELSHARMDFMTL